MSSPLRVLILEDSISDAELVLYELRQAGYTPDWCRVDNETDYLECLSPTLDIILADYTMPQFNALRALQLLKTRGLEIPFIIVTGTVGEEVVAECMRWGATDYLLKDRLGRLRSAVERALQEKHLNDEKKRAVNALRENEEKYRSLFESSPESITLVGLDGTILDCNEATAAIAGRPRSELIGKSFLDLDILDKADIPSIMKYFTNIAGGKLFDPFEVKVIPDDKEICWLEIYLSFLKGDDGIYAIQVIARDITDRKKAEQQIHALNAELLLAYDETLEGWARALDLRDNNTEDHSVRVMDLTMKLARMLGILEADLVHVRRGALLHDIGKMGIPDSILLKPGPLTEHEWQTMRMHPVFAYDLLSNIPFLRPALDIPYCHHEKWDGSGYPQGLCGEQIPLAARIFAVVDVWDALGSDRPYRKKWNKRKILGYIRAETGTHFDPEIVKHFLKLI